MAFTGRRNQLFEKLFLGKSIEILRVAKAIAPGFQTADRFLEGLFIGFPDAHHFADRTHLCTQLILDSLELFKGPARKFDHHIVAVRHVFIQRAVLAAGNILQG